MERKVHMGAQKVHGRGAKGAWMCEKRCTKVNKGARGCMNVCEKVRNSAQKVHKVHAGVQKARKGAQVGPEPGQSGWVVRVWWVQAQCRESQRSRKISKNPRKCACFDRAYHEDLTWRGLMGVAQGQEVCGGSAS